MGKRILLFGIVVCAMTPCSFTSASQKRVESTGRDDVTVLAFSRHTFRGIAETIGNAQVDLPEYGIELKVPILSYGKNASPRGIELVKKSGGTSLQNAASLAVSSLGEGTYFDSKWDEFRADLATERTLWTAALLRDSIYPVNQTPFIRSLSYFTELNKKRPPVTGCTTQAGNANDILSARSPVLKCIPKGILHQLQKQSSAHEKYRELSKNFLEVVRKVSKKNPQLEELMLPTPLALLEDEAHDIYQEAHTLASAIQMAAAVGPPLSLLFKDMPAASVNSFGKEALTAGMGSLGTRFLHQNPRPVADTVTLFPLKYYSQKAVGKHILVSTHDDYISNLLQAMDLVHINSSLADLAIYPMETVVFAISKAHASIVRMQIQVNNPDGFITGRTKATLLWKGTRSEWDAKLAALNKRVEGYDFGPEANACIKKLSVCEASELEMLY